VTGARHGTVVLFVFQLGTDLKVRTDADLVFDGCAALLRYA
jgi:hypothetical protein